MRRAALGFARLDAQLHVRIRAPEVVLGDAEAVVQVGAQTDALVGAKTHVKMDALTDVVLPVIRVVLLHVIQTVIIHALVHALVHALDLAEMLAITVVLLVAKHPTAPEDVVLGVLVDVKADALVARAAQDRVAEDAKVHAKAVVLDVRVAQGHAVEDAPDVLDVLAALDRAAGLAQKPAKEMFINVVRRL